MKKEISLSEKVHGWARKLEETMEKNKWSGICWDKSGMCEEDNCRCQGKEIIRPIIKEFQANPSEMMAQKVERLSGLEADFSDSDWGNGPKQ